jgi:hypothetical protein
MSGKAKITKKILIGVVICLSLLGAFIPSRVDAGTTAATTTNNDVIPKCYTAFDWGGMEVLVKDANGKIPETDKDYTDGMTYYKCPPITKLIVIILNWMLIGVGTVVIIFVVVGGIQYTTAAGNQESAKKGIEKIRNAVIALALYLVMLALLNFLVPGGIFYAT